ncbi:hypothetical protein SCOCK_210052 [Actinacidiphila cocklensis]|uniref:Uncharacterized protein n=1 Tax=Actinacidiphila cocklensis TaxID=887465 RepID=A0A9W4DTC8_9ACTN|nr:hypothetical protein SCOCK_210052 [Actinacidiphila cocklensis]
MPKLDDVNVGILSDVADAPVGMLCRVRRPGPLRQTAPVRVWPGFAWGCTGSADRPDRSQGPVAELLITTPERAEESAVTAREPADRRRGEFLLAGPRRQENSTDASCSRRLTRPRARCG